MGFIRDFFPQEVCHKRTRLTPTKLHRLNSIEVIESLNESTQLASKVFFERSDNSWDLLGNFWQEVCHKPIFPGEGYLYRNRISHDKGEKALPKLFPHHSPGSPQALPRLSPSAQ